MTSAKAKLASLLRGVATVSRLAVLLIAALFNRTSGQENALELRHGTILLYVLNPTQFVVVADSKLHVVSDSKVNGLGDGLCCKIVNLSHNTLFFYTGNLFEVFDNTGKTILSQQKAATQAFENFKTEARSKQRLVDVANKYSELVRPKIDELLRAGIKSDGVGLAGFASLDEFNHPRAVMVNFAFELLNNGTPAHTIDSKVFEPIPNKLYMGDYPPYKEVNEFLDAKTQRAKQAMEQFKSHRASLPEGDAGAYRLIAAVEASLNWNKNDPTIGPPVDAVVIEANRGIRWIKRKSMCLDSQSPKTLKQ
jgi:hypothetical protein